MRGVVLALVRRPWPPGWRPRRAWAVLIAGALAVTAAQAQPGWAAYTHSTGEQAEVRDGELRGRPHAGKRAYYLELLRALLQELGLPPQVEDVPLARGLMLLQNQDRVALVNVNRSPERETQLHWVGPVSLEHFYLYDNPGRPVALSRLEDARQLPVCVVKGSSVEALLQARGFARLTPVSSYTGCMRMLVAGRVRLAVAAESNLAQHLSEAQLDENAARSTGALVLRIEGYVALSRNTPQAEVARWQAALHRLTQNGRLQALWSQYALAASPPEQGARSRPLPGDATAR